MNKDLKKEQRGKQENKELLWRLKEEGSQASAEKKTGQHGRVESAL